MLVLPIKKKWFDMIVSGEKKEEYREIKPYYDKRLGNFAKSAGKVTTIILRNGYSYEAPSVKCKCTVEIGEGKKEWGADKGKEYYILTILEIIEIKNLDNPNPLKVKEAMATAMLPAINKDNEDTQAEIKKAIEKSLYKSFSIGIDLGNGTNMSGQSRLNMKEER
jgi:hypothetical protein